MPIVAHARPDEEPGPGGGAVLIGGTAPAASPARVAEARPEPDAPCISLGVMGDGSAVFVCLESGVFVSGVAQSGKSNCDQSCAGSGGR